MFTTRFAHILGSYAALRDVNSGVRFEDISKKFHNKQ